VSTATTTTPLILNDSAKLSTLFVPYFFQTLTRSSGGVEFADTYVYLVRPPYRYISETSGELMEVPSLLAIS